MKVDFAHNCPAACADPESFVRGGPTLADDEGEDPNTTVYADHHWPASETPK